MAVTHKNRLRTTISNTPGSSGALTISTASSGYRTFGSGDDGLVFDVVITDGTAWEVRTDCTYTHSGTSLSRGTLEDSSTGSAITLTSAAVVTVTATAAWGRRGDAAEQSLLSRSPAPVVGGIAVGDAGATGTLYEGYTLSWGDDFNTLDILAPHLPRGRWWPTRTYLAGARGSDTLLSTMFDTDPYFTGHNDSNRGVPVGYDNMRALHSFLTLRARKATSPEQTHMQSTRNEVAAMVSGAGAVHWFPSTAGTGDVIFEARVKFSAAAGNPSGWHPTMWLMSLNPAITADSDEIDWEGNADNAYFNRNVWTGGSQSNSTAGSAYAHDGAFHTISMLLNTTEAKLYIDGTLYATGAWNANSKSKPQYPLFTSHIYNGTFNSDTYSASEWNADTDGALMTVDWTRVWRRTARAHLTPRVDVPDQFVDYGSSLTVQLPTKGALWGDSTVTEYLQVVYNEENEPGVTHSTVFSQFPTGVSYNTSTRQVTVNITTGNTGRLNFVMSAWKADGSTGEPLRFAVNVGPNITASSLSYSSGASVSYDLYAVCDCGVLTSDGAAKAKTISVSGVGSSGLSYSDSTGLLTGTAVTGSYTLSVTCTNSVGQSVTDTIGVTVASAGPAYESWTGPGWFDASDTGSVSTSGSNVTSVANQRGGGDSLVAAGASVTYVSAVQNGLHGIRFSRDTSNPSRLTANNGTTSAISTPFQGNDAPYTVIAVYTPTDTNTGFIWAASDTVDATDNQSISLVRRSGSASSVRRQIVTASANDVNFGSGQASGTARIVAVKHTGTAVSVWDNSTTAVVSGTSQDTGAFNTELTFRVGAAETNGASDPTLAPTACAMDFFELVIESTAKSDGDIQQAITDLASKWGITI